MTGENPAKAHEPEAAGNAAPGDPIGPVLDVSPASAPGANAAAAQARTNRHIRLTSHPGQGGSGAPPLRWGAPDPAERGPIVGTTTQRYQSRLNRYRDH